VLVISLKLGRILVLIRLESTGDDRILLPLIDGWEADGAFDAEFAAGARKRAQDHHDGNVLGRALLRVLGVGAE